MCLYIGEVEDVLDIVGVESLMLTKVFHWKPAVSNTTLWFRLFIFLCVLNIRFAICFWRMNPWVFPGWKRLLHHHQHGVRNGRAAQGDVEGECPLLHDGLLLLSSHFQPFHFPVPRPVLHRAGPGHHLHGVRSGASHLWNYGGQFSSWTVQLPVELVPRRLHQRSVRMLAHTSAVSQPRASRESRCSLRSWPNHSTQVVLDVLAAKRIEKRQERFVQQQSAEIGRAEFPHLLLFLFLLRRAGHVVGRLQ